MDRLDNLRQPSNALIGWRVNDRRKFIANSKAEKAPRQTTDDAEIAERHAGGAQHLTLSALSALCGSISRRHLQKKSNRSAQAFSASCGIPAILRANAGGRGVTILDGAELANIFVCLVYFVVLLV